MASVVVNGDTSGAVTLSAPAVAGTVTVTLPSTSGVMAVGGGTITTLTTTSDITVQGVTVGRGAGAVSTNTAVGASALAANSTGNNSTSIGYETLKLSTGDANTAIGAGALDANTSGSFNSAVGRSALGAATTANSNSAFGYLALLSNTTGASNVSVGAEALYSNTTAINNTAVGYQAGYSQTTTGYGTFLGQTAGYATTGISNTFVGQQAGALITSGAKNTIIGRYDGNQGGLDIRTASNYIVLSDGDGNPRMYNAGSYYWSLVGTSATTCGAILFRNSSQTQYWNNEASSGEWYVFGSSTYVYFAQGGSSWVFSSDRRIKENIVDIDYGLNAVMQLKPRRYDNTTNEKNEIGFVAQELREVIPEAVTGEEIEFDENDTTMERAKKSLGVSKDTLIPVLVKAIQELKAEVDSLKAQINGASA